MARSVEASTAANGSSIKNRSASCTSARARKRPLLLTTAQLTDLPILKSVDSNLSKSFQSAILLSLSDRSAPTQLTIGAHQDHIQDRGWEVPIDRFSLGHVSHSGALLSISVAKDLDRSTHHRHHSQDGFQQRALSSPVRSDQSNQAGCRNIETNFPKNRLSMISDRQIANRNDRWRLRVAHGRTPRNPPSGGLPPRN